MTDYTAKRIDEMEALYGGGFVKARASLGATAFGMQLIQLPPGSDGHPNHDHAESGQEEVYVTLSGSGWMEIEDERAEMDPQTLIRVGPEVKRKVHAGPEGLRMLVIGGTPGRPYEVWAASELGAGLS
ncbi:MAG: cupin domain-containing protein [Solirubrobacteraceae bacterium]